MAHSTTCTLVLAGLCAATSASPSIRIIAASSQPAPGLTGVTFVDIGDPRFTQTGLGFMARLAGTGVTTANDYAMFSDLASSGIFTLRLRESQALPEGTIGGLSSVQISSDNKLAFTATLLPGNRPAQGTAFAFAESPTGFTLLAADTNVNSLAPSLTPIDAAGRSAWAQNPIAPVDPRIVSTFGTSFDNQTIIPGVPPEQKFRVFRSPHQRGGMVAFKAGIAPDASSPRRWGIFSTINGSLATHALANDAAPGIPDATIAELGDPTIITPGSGTALISWARVQGTSITVANDGVIMLHETSGSSTLLREGDAATVDRTYGSFSRQFAVNAAGMLAFRTSLAGGSTPESVIITKPLNQPAEIALRTGEELSGTLAGLTVAQLGEPVISDSDDLVVPVRLAGLGVTPTNNSALLVRWNGAWSCAMRSGWLVDSAGTPRTVNTFVFDSGSSDSGLNQIHASTSSLGPTLAVKLNFRPVNSTTPVISAIAGITITCPADYNADGVADFFDYLDFVADFAANRWVSDFNRDNVVDFFDYLALSAPSARGADQLLSFHNLANCSAVNCSARIVGSTTSPTLAASIPSRFNAPPSCFRRCENSSVTNSTNSRGLSMPCVPFRTQRSITLSISGLGQKHSGPNFATRLGSPNNCDTTASGPISPDPAVASMRSPTSF